MKNLFKFFISKFSRAKPEISQEQADLEAAQFKSREKLQGYTEEEIFGKEGADIKNMLEDFEKASKNLAIRIYPKDFVSSFQLEELVYRKDLEGTITMLVLDHPDSVESLLKTTVEKWGKNVDDLFSLAIENLRSKYKRELERTENNFLKFSGEDIFITSAALYIDKYRGCIGKYGTVFCLPNRDTLLCKPINSDLDVEVGLQLMIPLAENTFDSSSPDLHITRSIFWHHEGKNELIYTYYGLNRLKYILPTDLEELVY